MSPLIFNFPPIKAETALSSPLNILAKSSLSKLISQSAPFGAAPSPQLPLPFFKSKYHSPLSAPIIKGKKEN